uniref:GATA-type domain-containing protein n=1 Tax=Kalanchoe fedtschenkoi TaxID=63787 RepID=A0A7N0UF90_KALFE
MVSGMMDDGSECGGLASKKLCVDCGTSKTPLWRGGPAGPKSLCNACGIRSRKRRRALLESTEADENKKKMIGKKMKHMINSNSDSNGSHNSSSSSSSNNGHLECSRKDRLTAMWDILKPRKVRMEELNEEQEAAVLLMAMSHGYDRC